jgi:mitochondrial fission process protein 1
MILDQAASSASTTSNYDYSSNMKQDKEVDLWRDTPLRLLGYANETGESFRYIFPKMVRPSYAVSYAYTFADCIDKGYKTYKKDGRVSNQCAINTFDALTWQILASVAIPGYLINKTVAFATFVLGKRFPSHTHFGPVPVRFVPVIVGLSTIPFIVSPIDNFTTYLMNMTMRKCYESPDSEDSHSKKH